MMTTTIPNFAVNQSLEANWAKLTELTSTLMSASGAHSTDAWNTRDEAAQYNMLLNELRHDRVVPGKDKEGKDVEVRLLGLMRAPGSKNRHHNVQGGLVRHLLQMWEVWVDLRAVVQAHNAFHPQLNDLNVWKCILHHDLNKVWKYKLESEDPWKADYANEHDRLSQLLGDTNKVMFLLNKHGIKLPIPLHNALITAEGGYSTSPRPYAETVLAKVAYLLDELSANVIDRLQTGRFWDSKAGGISENGHE